MEKDKLNPESPEFKPSVRLKTGVSLSPKVAQSPLNAETPEFVPSGSSGSPSCNSPALEAAADAMQDDVPVDEQDAFTADLVSAEAAAAASVDSNMCPGGVAISDPASLVGPPLMPVFPTAAPQPAGTFSFQPMPNQFGPHLRRTPSPPLFTFSATPKSSLRPRGISSISGIRMPYSKKTTTVAMQTDTKDVAEKETNTRRTKTSEAGVLTLLLNTREVYVNTVESLFDKKSSHHVDIVNTRDVLVECRCDVVDAEIQTDPEEPVAAPVTVSPDMSEEHRIRAVKAEVESTRDSTSDTYRLIFPT